MKKEKKIYLLQESKTFCMFPWMHIYANPNGFAFPCCTAEQDKIKKNTKDYTLDEIFNSDDWKNLRKDMLAGVKNETCRRCYEVDDAGGFSYRRYANTGFDEFVDIVDKTSDDGFLDNPEYRYIDIRFSNLCNFLCSTCGPVFSTAWGKKAREYKWHNFGYVKIEENAKQSIFEQLKPHFHKAKEIYFAGGEPLMMDEHYRILEYLNDNNIIDIRLRYNSNLSRLEYKKENIVDLWKNIREVRMGASIDGVNEVAELIRYGTTWNDIENNMKKLLLCNNIMVNVDTVVSILNIAHLPTMYNYLFDNKLVNEKSWFSVNLAFTPLEFSLTSLPISYKDKFAKIIDDYIIELHNKTTPVSNSAKQTLIQSLESAIRFMYSKDTFDQQSFSKLVETNIFDKEKLKTALPDIYVLSKGTQNEK